MDIDIQIFYFAQIVKLDWFTIFGDIIDGLTAKRIWVLRKVLYGCYSVMQNRHVH